MIDYLKNDETVILRFQVKGIPVEAIQILNTPERLVLGYDDPLSWNYALEWGTRVWDIAAVAAFFNEMPVEANLRGAKLLSDELGGDLAARVVHYYSSRWGCSTAWIIKNLNDVKKKFAKFMEVQL